MAVAPARAFPRYPGAVVAERRIRVFFPIDKYLFSDEGKGKGTVKVYIEARAALKAGGDTPVPNTFRDAQVEFHERALVVRAWSDDGRAWLFRVGRLFGPVRTSECRYALSSTGHKVSITLKKSNAAVTWHRLAETAGPTGSAGDRGPPLVSVQDFV